ncbi:MAG TPA: tetratricopeptide repeat protein [Thermoanaerobaculia bacterium]|jgi:tetratricopeptide (TPR) repeat protein|nr:tetratricopeptide repeat protein [Thermoanaerobaculia bacterium]
MARCFATALIVATLLAPAAARAQEMPEVARNLMEEAERASEENRIDDAIAKYKRVIAVAPALAPGYVNLGALYFKQGRVAEAYDIFVRGVARIPADRTLLSNAAATAQQLGKSADALKYVDDAIARNPRDASLHTLRSTILRSLNRNDDALAAITRAAQLAPDDAKVQFSLGNILVSLGRKGDAIAAYQKAVHLDHTFVRAYFNLGAMLFDAGRYVEAAEAYRVALAPADRGFANRQPVDASNARAYANLGAIYLKQEKWAEAIDAYQKAANLDDDTAAHYNLGFLFFTTGKTDRAQDEYRKALAGNASLPLAYLHIGTIAFRAARYDDAIKFLRDGMPHFDADAKRPALRMLGRAQLIRGDQGGARTSLEEALALDANDGELLLLLGRIARHEQRLDDAKSLLERAQLASPRNMVVTLERALVAREANDLTAERVALEALPDRPPLRAELAVVALRQSPSAANLRALHVTSPEVTAVLDALDGRRDAAARSLAQSPSPIAGGDAGLLLWQLGLPNEAKPHLAAAHKAFADWNEITLASGEIALMEKRYDDAAELLSSIRCDASPALGRELSGPALELALGVVVDPCGRAKTSLANALLLQAADELDRAVKRQDEAGARRVRQLADRAASLDERKQSLALCLRGTADLVAGADASARETLARAIGGNLPPAVETIAKKNLEAAQPAKDAPQPEETTTSQPRRTVVVFLPDTPAETEKKLAEAATAIVGSLATASSLPLTTELFRRAEDARTFITANRDRVGVVIANPEFIPREFSPRYAFSREGRTTYVREVVVPNRSAAKSLADLQGRTISGVDALGDDGVSVTTHVADDLTALANALYGRTDAALVSEANPLLAEHTRDLRVVYTTVPQPLPVAAFAPMPAADRAALDDAFRSLPRTAFAPLRFTGVVRTGSEPRLAAKREIQALPAASLGLKLDPPIALPLRVAVDLPRVEIPEDLFGPP